MYFYCADPANKCVHCKTSWVIGRNLSDCSQCAKAVNAEHNDPLHDIANYVQVINLSKYYRNNISKI